MLAHTRIIGGFAGLLNTVATAGEVTLFAGSDTYGRHTDTFFILAAAAAVTDFYFFAFAGFTVGGIILINRSVTMAVFITFFAGRIRLAVPNFIQAALCAVTISLTTAFGVLTAPAADTGFAVAAGSPSKIIF